MGEVRFRSRPAASGDDGFTISISEDGQAFTLVFSGLQAEVNATTSPAVARVFSLVLPVDGADSGTDISFATSGFAFAEEGTSGTAVLSVNGQTSVERILAGADQEFVQQLKVQGGPTAALQLVVVLVAERDGDHPEGTANLSATSVDGEIQPRRADGSS